MIKFDIKNRFTGNVIFTADIDAREDNSYGFKLSLAVKVAVKNRADLSEANLSGANLYGANLSRADLSRANLSGADLSGANLSGANLSRAFLYGANLSRAILSEAILSKANLSEANLYGANLSGAVLSEAILSGAFLSRANLSGAKNVELAVARTRILPEGSLIGWKKCANDVIVKLRIPEEAKRSHAFGRKCRAEYVDVLEIFGDSVAKSERDPSFTYQVGQRVVPKNGFSDNWQEECEAGIHFFITREEAEDY